MGPRVPIPHFESYAAQQPNRPAIVDLINIQDVVAWLICFCSFTSLLLISWSATLPGQQLTTIMVLLFIAPWVVIVLRQPRRVLHGIATNWLLLSLPVLAICSTLWSDFPAVTLKGGTQYLVTVLAGICAGCCVKPRVLMSSLLAALFLLAVLSVLDGTVEYNELTGGQAALAGLFGSKNYFAVCVSFLLLTATSVAADRFQSIGFRLLGIAGAILAIPLLIYARSVGALVVSVATLATIVALRIALKLSPRARLTVLLLLFLLTAVAVGIATFDVDYADILNYFGKDLTLTGRTLLWDYAAKAIADKPLLGGGYEAFWQPGHSAAEQLWFYSHIQNKYGYHFHNTYLEIAVDAGVIGLCMFLATLVGAAFRTVVVLATSKPSAEQIFAITLFLFLLLRTPLEVDLFFQFQLPTILLCLIWIYLKPSRYSAAVGVQKQIIRSTRQSPEPLPPNPVLANTQRGSASV
jgi:exopolysaccharide production protein ExoQ